MLLLERHEQKCNRRLRVRTSIAKNIPRRLGGNASRVASDNIPIVTGNEDQPAEVADTVPELAQSRRQRSSRNKIEDMGLLIEEIGRRTNRKLAETLIHLLNDDFPNDSFRQHCQTFADCQSLSKGLIETNVSDLKFSKGILRIGTLETEYFYRCPVKLLQAQIMTVNSEEITKEECVGIDVNGRRCSSSPFSAELGHQGIKAIREAIQVSENPEVYWRDDWYDIGESFVGLGQLYSDKSQASLKPDAFTFYPLHITMFNFPEYIRRNLIVKGMTTVAYLPIAFSSTEMEGNYYAERSERLSMVQKTISKVLEPLTSRAEVGFPCQTNDNVKLHCHFAIANYCADIPEAKDMLGILHSNRTTHPCFRCLAGKKELSVFKEHTLRTLEDTKRMRNTREKALERSRELHEAGRVRKSYVAEANKELVEKSMNSLPCFLEAFPFVGIAKVLDLYQIYSFEPLHALHIGISKLLKALIYDRLGDKTLASKALGNKLFTTVRSHILTAVNQMLSRFHRESYAPGLYLDLVSKQKGKKMNGLYTEHGLRGFLEAKNMKGIDRVFPFIAAFIDRCCGEKENAPTTKVAVLFTDLVKLSERRGMAAGWTEPDLLKLETKVREFKKEALQLYEKYQKSGMNTMNFHLIDHLVSDIRRNGGIQYGDACLYEYSHVRVKDCYRETSKRRATALQETLESYHKSLLKGHTNEFPHDMQYKGARYEAFQKDGAVLVRDGKKIEVRDITMAREYIRSERKGREMIAYTSPEALQLVRDVGEDGAQSLISLLQEEFSDVSNLDIVRVSSAYLTGGFIPTSEHVFRDRNGVNQIRYMEIRRKVSQRVVSCRGFHGSKTLRQDCVMIEREKHGKSSREVWIGKVLALLRVKKEEFAFIQYFDATADTDNCMATLQCVNLRISRTDNCDNDRGFGKYYGLVPTGSLRGAVHVVRGDHGSPQTLPESEWPDQIYHVNRFYVDPDEMEYSKA